MILQVAKLGPVSRAAGMDCEYPLDLTSYRQCTKDYVNTKFIQPGRIRLPGRKGEIRWVT